MNKNSLRMSEYNSVKQDCYNKTEKCYSCKYFRKYGYAHHA